MRHVTFWIGLFLVGVSGIARAAPDSAECASKMDGTRSSRRRVHYSVPFLTDEAFSYSSTPDLNLPVDQQTLDQLQAARRPDRTDLIDRLRARHVFDHLLIAVHLLPHLQAEAARRLENLSLADVPRIAMVSPSYPLRDPKFYDFADYFLLSDHGESSLTLRGRTVYLIGGFEQACLANAMMKVVNDAIEAGLNEMTIHMLVDHTYAKGVNGLRWVRDSGNMSDAEATAIIKTTWHNFIPVPGSLRRGAGRVEVRLARAAMRNYVPRNKSMMEFKVVIE